MRRRAVGLAAVAGGRRPRGRRRRRRRGRAGPRRSRSTRAPARSTGSPRPAAQRPEGAAPRGAPPPGRGRPAPRVRARAHPRRGRRARRHHGRSPTRARRQPGRASAAAPTCSAGSPTGAPASRSPCSTSASARTSARLQALGELPPPERLETLSFDAAGGLAGTNAYGNRTNHGELVAQTVYDYAPSARYLFVNYHTEADFLAATDAHHRPAARHRRALQQLHRGPLRRHQPGRRGRSTAPPTAGILWFNSAGNYAQLHWERRRGPTPTPTATSTGPTATTGPSRAPPACRSPSRLSWPSPAERPAHRPRPRRSSARAPTAPGPRWPRSADRQSAGAPAGRADHRLLAAAPTASSGCASCACRGRRPTGPLTLFSREIPLRDDRRQRSTAASPRPATRAAPIAVGAIDWRGNALKSYSVARGRPPTAA